MPAHKFDDIKNMSYKKEKELNRIKDMNNMIELDNLENPESQAKEEVNFNKNMLIAELNKIIKRALTPNEQFVIHEYFFEDKTYDFISKELLLSRERIRQIINKSLKKLKFHLENAGISPSSIL
jgi:RNA polymerase sigma factor (sigma-70 family)